MKFKEYLMEANQIIDYNKLSKILSKNVKDKKLINDLMLSFKPYNSTNIRIYLQHKNTLMDELWYRLGSSYEESEKFPEKVLKQLKTNFYTLKDTMFKNFIKKGNYFTNEI